MPSKVKGSKEIVPTASDYDLKNCNETLRGLAFIHACGKLEEFLDKLYSAFPALIFFEETRSNTISPSEQDVSQTVLDNYDYQLRKSLASLAFGNHVTNINQNSLPNYGNKNLQLNLDHSHLRQRYNELYNL